MPIYQNYSTMNNPYQPAANPYMDRMNYWQQYQQNLQPQQMVPAAAQVTNVSKMVDSIDAVKAADIPMDGNLYYFPKADGTAIFSKQWLANGQTRILTFKPVLDADPNNLPQEDKKPNIGLSEDATEMFMQRFDAIEKRLDDILSKKPAPRAKKEADQNE